jgi:hypothetical protein
MLGVHLASAASPERDSGQVSRHRRSPIHTAARGRKVFLINPTSDVNVEGANRPVGQHTEPSHLLGMHNTLVEKGYECRIVDAFGARLSVSDTAAIVNRERPDALAITVYDTYDHMKYVDTLVRVLEYQPSLVVGGYGATHSTDHVVDVLRPDFVVKGEGELPIASLAETGFRAEGLKRSPHYRGRLKGTVVLESQGLCDMDALGFERPYSLNAYDAARVNWQRGCKGRCSFCNTPDRVRELELRCGVTRTTTTACRPTSALSRTEERREQPYLRDAAGAVARQVGVAPGTPA